MSKKLIVMGDPHFRKVEPFFSAQKESVNWFIKQDFNNEENYYVNLGDVFDSSSPNPDAIDLAIDFNNKLKFKEKNYLVGSHDYNRLKNSYSPTPLGRDKNTEIFYEPAIINIKNLKCLILPFIYDKTFLDKSMKEYYENLPEKYSNQEYDFIFHHVQDSSIKFNAEDDSGINLDYLKGKRIGGHIHHRRKGYLGTPLINRFDEKGKDSFILIIDLETKEEEYIEVPKFMDYETIDYEIDCPDPCIRIFDIINAPSRAAAEEKFKGLFLRNIELKKTLEESKEVVEEQSASSIKDHFINFCNKQKVSKSLKNKLNAYIN